MLIMRAEDVPSDLMGFFEPIDMAQVGDAWLLSPEPTTEAHFAVFVSEVPRRCSLLGTSGRGVCPQCGAPWSRVVEGRSEETRAPSGWDTSLGSHDQLTGRYSPRIDYEGKNASQDEHASHRRLLAGVRGARAAGGDHDNPFPPKATVGWRPTCEHTEADPIPATILDPFAGSGTSLMVAKALGRRSIGCELSPDYCRLAEKRISSVPLPMGVGV